MKIQDRSNGTKQILETISDPNRNVTEKFQFGMLLQGKKYSENIRKIFSDFFASSEPAFF